jgi:pimeloyl-ACP methyl ester carboxylesterase
VIVPDLPGHGWSSRARGRPLIAGFALHVRDLLMGLGIQRATFVGHSLGGGVTMQTAYAYPELVGRMVLLNIAHEAVDRHAAGRRRPGRDPVAREGRQVRDLTYRDLRRRDEPVRQRARPTSASSPGDRVFLLLGRSPSCTWRCSGR